MVFSKAVFVSTSSYACRVFEDGVRFDILGTRVIHMLGL